jgi:hypothetical protein
VGFRDLVNKKQVLLSGEERLPGVCQIEMNHSPTQAHFMFLQAKWTVLRQFGKNAAHTEFAKGSNLKSKKALMAKAVLQSLHPEIFFRHPAAQHSASVSALRFEPEVTTLRSMVAVVRLMMFDVLGVGLFLHCSCSLPGCFRLHQCHQEAGRAGCRSDRRHHCG